MARRSRGHWLEPRRRTGIWQVCWTENRRKITRSTGTRDEEAARQWLERYLTALATPDQPEEATVASIVDGYLAEKAPASTIRVGCITATHLKRHLGWLTVDELRPSHSRRYAETRRQAGRKNGTIRRELATLRAALNWARGERLVAAVPAVPMPPAVEPRSRWLSKEEAERLIAGAKAAHIRLFIRIALGTGARSGAILSLTWDRIDFERHAIDFGWVTGGKGRAVVPLAMGLEGHLTEARATAQTPYVIEWNGQRVARILEGFQTAVERAGIEHCTPHDLRRTAGSWMLAAGIPIEVVSRMLGHRDVRVTQSVYAWHTVEWLRGAAEALER